MSILADLLAGGASGLLAGVGQFAKDLREAITGKSILDANKSAEILMNAAAIEAAAAKMCAEYDKSQMEGQAAIAKLEAASQDKYVTRWRPTVGWACAIGLLYTFIVRPLLWWCVMVAFIIVGKPNTLPSLPEIALGELLVLLGGMLGLGGMRSYEKVKGVGSVSIN